MDRCDLCPRVNNCLGPSGPQTKGGILFIGEAPGRDENKKLQVFIGKTGDEVNRHYLPLAGLRRASVNFANAISCLPVTAGGKLDPNRSADIALLESCASQNLYPLIERLQPRLLVPLGSFACRAVFGESFDLELRHGLPTDSPWGCPAFPMYHPALGIHEPKKMLYLRTDWQRLRKFIEGTLPQRSDPFTGVEDYQEVEHASEISDIPDGPLGADTESTAQHEAFCLTYSFHGGSGRLIRASRPDLIRAFGERLRTHHGPILFHNFLYDWAVIERMGLRIQPRSVVDTMAKVFHLGNLPQGLKALAFRELGMTMEGFEDLVMPYSRVRVLDYFEQARVIDWPKPDERVMFDEKSGLWKVKKPQGMNTKLKRFYTDLRKYGDNKDVFKAWENWESEHEMIEGTLGPWPGMCITHVPFERVLFYACRDADALIRLWPILKAMGRVVRKYTQNEWRDRCQN